MSSSTPLDKPAASPRARIAGRATPQETLRYAARFQGRSAAGHFREAPGGLLFSSIGIGTYLGEPDGADRQGATPLPSRGRRRRHQRGGLGDQLSLAAQRTLRRRGARELVAKGFARDEIVLCTKAGFLTPDGEMPAT